jgi:O-methyltransferase involved in polyketide biosynthesis
VFDYIQASVLRGENQLYGEAGLVKTVSKAREHWRFGIDPGEVALFLQTFGFRASDHKNAQELESVYFTNVEGHPVGRVNGAHCIVTAERL